MVSREYLIIFPMTIYWIVEEFEKYLGLPFFVERSKKASFSYIKQYEKWKKKKVNCFLYSFLFWKKKNLLIYFYVLHEVHVFISKYN